MLPAPGPCPPRGQQYDVRVVVWFQFLVVGSGASLRCAAQVLHWFALVTGLSHVAPDRSTGRSWLLRIGLATLERPKVIADDWAWMIDHSVQSGPFKCLVILGIQLSELPEGRPLVHEDLEPIALVPMRHSTAATVATCLEETVAKTGVPRVILDDHGTDLHGGVELFRQSHPETIEIYDITHKAACLLKARLERDERWQTFGRHLAQTKCAVQQTELAPLAPPRPAAKARFMNVGKLVAWACATLAILDDPARQEPLETTPERLESKLGWLRNDRDALEEWSACQTVIDGALSFVRTYGVYRGAERELDQALPNVSGAAAELRAELIAFGASEGAKARPNERLPGTTEPLESCFGKLKAIEDGQSQSGFTGLVLALGAMVSKHTPASVKAALEHVRVRDVVSWCRKMLGRSVQSRRREAYRPAQCATKLG